MLAPWQSCHDLQICAVMDMFCLWPWVLNTSRKFQNTDRQSGEKQADLLRYIRAGQMEGTPCELIYLHANYALMQAPPTQYHVCTSIRGHIPRNCASPAQHCPPARNIHPNPPLRPALTALPCPLATCRLPPSHLTSPHLTPRQSSVLMPMQARARHCMRAPLLDTLPCGNSRRVHFSRAVPMALKLRPVIQNSAKGLQLQPPSSLLTSWAGGSPGCRRPPSRCSPCS